MQTNAVLKRESQRTFDIKGWLNVKRKSVNVWLNAKSSFYSRVCEFAVSRRTVLRVNMVTACVILGAFAIEQQPVMAITAATCAAWLVYRLNKDEKKGGKK